MPYRYDPYACDPHYYDEDPPECDCGTILPDTAATTWTKEEPVGEDLDGNWMYDTVRYALYICPACGEDTVRNNL